MSRAGTPLIHIRAAIRRTLRTFGRDLHLPAVAPALPRRVLLAAVVLGLAICWFNQLGVPLRASHSARVTADEPFYLLTTVSLLEDGDLDLANDYALHRYRAFFDHPQDLWHQSDPTPDGRVLSPHNPGLSVLILPAYALGGLDGVKGFLGALSGATALVMVLIAYRATGSLWASSVAAALLAVSAPLFIYATQIYPEAPAALVIAACVWLLLGSSPGWRTALLLALGLTCLVWLGTKYALVGAVIGLLALVRRDAKGRVLVPALLVPSAALYAGFHLATFGALTPYSVNRVYAGSTTMELVALHFELWNRLYRFAGLWIDGEFGLVRWAPVLLLTLPAIPLLARRAGPVRWILPLVIGVQLLVAVFLSITMRGWWFPGRMLVPVLPLLVIPLAQTLLILRGYPVLAGVAAILGVATAGTSLALQRAAAVQQVVLAVDPFALDWFPFQMTTELFPVYTSYQTSTWLLTAGWIVLSGALLWLGVVLRQRSELSATEVRDRAVSQPSLPESA